MRKIFVLVCVVVIILFMIGCSKNAPIAPVFPTPTPTEVVTPMVESFNVTLSSASPAPANILEGQSGVEFVRFVLTNSTNSAVTVTNLSVRREGTSTDSSLTRLYLFDNGINIAECNTISSGIASFYSSSGIITISPGLSVTITVKADVATGTSDQTIFLSLQGITANFQPSPAYPLSGSVMTIQ